MSTQPVQLPAKSDVPDETYFMTDPCIPIGITAGDACGVGPEILVRSAARGDLDGACVVYGDRAAIELAAEKTGAMVDLNPISSPASCQRGRLNLIDLALLRAADITIGEVSRSCGNASVAYVEHATRACLEHAIAAMVTLPINKEACRLTHPGFQGHTEFIAGICGSADYGMMLAGSKMIVTHVSTHVSLREAIALVTEKNVLRTLRMTPHHVSALRGRARIAVAGLNPHAGEHGAFGREDVDAIAPAVEAARAEGIDVSGPLPPDTVFYRMARGEFDAVVCMYHDQGHIPMKLQGFGDTVNVTLGLPVIRTSVDHGTAFDIAYQGIADIDNFGHALDLARKLSGLTNSR